VIQSTDAQIDALVYEFMGWWRKTSRSLRMERKVRELVNLQDVDGKAKPYQIRQFLRLVERYNLTMEDES
jgi:hypothetical protein